MNLNRIIDSNLLPDFALRFGIRQVVAMRLREQQRGGPDAHTRRMNEVIAELGHGTIAEKTDAANSQHYEVPSEFYELVLGEHLKYSGCYWPADDVGLDGAERASLEQVCERAELVDGMDILELGCGWGSLSLFMAQRYPNSRIVALSNSASQRQLILDRAAGRKLDNLEVITGDVNVVELTHTFDRIVSVEMFEHMRNYRELFARISSWLRPAGKLFVHVFAHTRYAYLYDNNDDSDWMAREFFSGGVMPSQSLFLHFQDHLRVTDQWALSGRHYQLTAEAWLSNIDRNRARILELFERHYGADQATAMFARWRVFFMACAELFGYRRGREWIIAHYLFEQVEPRA
jgi:cyclopropane-fatty-acyl-phospholipid synthase